MNYIEPEYKKMYSNFQTKGRINKCFFCGKETGVIMSHSISEKKCLSLLAEKTNGNKGVYSFKDVNWSYSNWYQVDGFGDFELVGLNKASTFKGFCATDDRNLFKLIDESPFDINSLEQCFLYCYRAFAKAYHTKLEEQKSCESESEYKRRYIRFVANRKNEIDIGLNLDIKDYPYLMNLCLNRHDYTSIKHIYFKTKSFLPIASSSFCQPSFSINGNRLNDYKDSNKPLNHIFINIIPEENCTHILLSCFKQQEEAKKFLEELETSFILDKNKVGLYLTTLLIFHTENTFMAPSIIENLSYHTKRMLLLNLRHCVTEGYVRDFFLDNPIRGHLNLFLDKLE